MHAGSMYFGDALHCTPSKPKRIQGPYMCPRAQGHAPKPLPHPLGPNTMRQKPPDHPCTCSHLLTQQAVIKQNLTSPQGKLRILGHRITLIEDDQLELVAVKTE